MSEEQPITLSPQEGTAERIEQEQINEAEEQVEIQKSEGEQLEGEHLKGEELEGEHLEGEQTEGEQVEGEQFEGEENEKVDGEQSTVAGEGLHEELEGEQLEGELVEGEEAHTEKVEEEQIEEEEYVEPPPPDPAAPYDFSDSKEALREPFELRPEQLVEVEILWETYQNYTPAYTDIAGYITQKELVYMLQALLLMTYTEEQLQELIAFCVRPPHPEGHIDYEQFLQMVIMRQRDFPVEEELRAALQVLDPQKTGQVDRTFLKEVLSERGYKMSAKLLDLFIKEVDISNTGEIGIDDVVATMCMDLNKEDLMLLRNAVFPPDETNNPPLDDD